MSNQEATLNQAKASADLEPLLDALCDAESYPNVFRHVLRNKPMPSIRELGEFVSDCKAVLFPGFFGINETEVGELRRLMALHLGYMRHRLQAQALLGLCFACAEDAHCLSCEDNSRRVTEGFMARLPELRRILSADVQAAYDGDPAAKDLAEIIFCYPSIQALINHRVAHELYRLGLPIIPRIISEMAHSVTGIDIHPGAAIGEGFFIDHGTGVVIGETSVIGKNVRLYQSVTLGAKSFPKDAAGNPIKGVPRHPIVEDDVVVYAGATILGRITIGRGAVIGGNTWVTEDVAPNARVMQK